MTDRAERMLVLGLDSAEPKLIERYLAEGCMPNTQALLAASASRSFASPTGFGAAATWTTLFTGAGIADHGRYYFQQLLPGTYDVVRVDDTEAIQQPSLWQRLSDAGHRVFVVDGERTPLSSRLNGWQLVNWTAHSRTGPARSTPPEFAEMVIGRYGDDPLGGNSDAFNGSAARYRALVDALPPRIETKTRFCKQHLTDHDWDFAWINYAEPHDVGHMCWHLHDPEHPDHDPNWIARLGDPMRQVYIGIDAAIGEMVALADARTTVVLIAGPGMEAGYSGNHMLGDILASLQHQQSASSCGAANTDVRIVDLYKQVVPFRLRKWLRDRRQPGREQSARTARANSRFFALPHNQNSGAIRINLQGREPSGTITAGAQYDACCAELTKDLAQLVDANTGARVVREVIKVADHYQGAALATLPDLLVVWERHAPLVTIESPKTGLIRKQYGGPRTGDHTTRCLFSIRGPGFGAATGLPELDAQSVTALLAAQFGIDLTQPDSPPAG